MKSWIKLAAVGAIVVVVVVDAGCVSGRSLCCFGPPPCFGYDQCSVPFAAPLDDGAAAVEIHPRVHDARAANVSGG